MGAQAACHLRWPAPRLAAVYELALLDWVCLACSGFCRPLNPAYRVIDWSRSSIW